MNQISVCNNMTTFVGACTAAFVLAAILKCWLYANLYRLPPPFAEDGSRWSSGIGRGKSIGLAEGMLLPAEAVDSNRSRPKPSAVAHVCLFGSVGRFQVRNLADSEIVFFVFDVL